MDRRRWLVGLMTGVAVALVVGALLVRRGQGPRYEYPTRYPGCTVILRVLDERGPVAGRTLELEVESRSGNFGSGGVTGEDGSLRVPVAQNFDSRELVEAGFLPHLLKPPQDVTITVSDERSFARLEHAGYLPSGDVDLGDIVLRPKALLVEGRVVDGEGAPVSGARVYADMEARLSDIPGTTTDDSGAFVLHSPADWTEGAQSLVAIQGDRLSESWPFESGARDVQLVLDQTRAFGSFRGRVLLDSEIPSERIVAHLMPIGFRPILWDLELDLERRPLDSRGEFRFEKCLAGRNVLRLLIDDQHSFDGQELLELDDVIVGAGVGSTDPRCELVDLRGKIHAFRLTLIRPDGSPAAAGKLLVDERRRTLRELRGWTELDTPTHVVLTTQSAVELDVRVPGCRGVHLHNVSEDRTVQLQPGFPLRLVLPEDVELPPPHVTWSVRLHGERIDVLDAPAEFAAGSRELRVVSAEPGTVEVEWLRVESLGGDHVRASSWGAIEGEPRQRLEILDVPGEQMFELLPLAPR